MLPLLTLKLLLPLLLLLQSDVRVSPAQRSYSVCQELCLSLAMIDRIELSGVAPTLAELPYMVQSLSTP